MDLFAGLWVSFAGAVVIWVVVFGGTASWIASTKGHGEITWFVLGVVLGPYASLVVGLSSDRHQGPGWERCGACLEPVRSGATRCPHCTITLIDDDCLPPRRKPRDPGTAGYAGT